MDKLSLFTLLLACATLLLAGASFWTIRQNYTFRREDKETQVKLETTDEIKEWARKARETILDSLSQYWVYLKEVNSNLNAQQANLEERLKMIKAKKVTKLNQEEYIKLEKEASILEGERLTKNDYQARVLILLKDVLTEFDIIKIKAKQLGKVFEPSVVRIDQSLTKIIESLNSETESYQPDKSVIIECNSALNQLILDTTSVKSLLLRYGSKVKL